MFTENLFERNGEYLRYYRHDPAGAGKKPLLVYLHGAGSRGDDLSLMSRLCVFKEMDEGREIDAVIVAPQCHKDNWNDQYETLTAFIRSMIDEPMIDESRVYICGASMGGYGTWAMITSHPDWFAAAVPVCGGGMYWNAGRLKNVPIWAFHGALDTTVLSEESIHMVKAVNNNGGHAKLTIYPDVAHDAWTPAFADDEMWAWMFAQRRG